MQTAFFLKKLEGRCLPNIFFTGNEGKRKLEAKSVSWNIIELLYQVLSFGLDYFLRKSEKCCFFDLFPF